MEQVVLHAPDHARERRQDRGQHAVAIQRFQHAHRPGAAAQQGKERGQHGRIARQAAAVLDQGVFHRAHRGGGDAGAPGHVEPFDEHLHQPLGRLRQPIGVAQFEAAAAHHEVRIEVARRRQRLQEFLQAFQQLDQQALGCACGAEVFLHEALDRVVAGRVGVGMAQPRRQRALPVKQQAFLGTAGFEVQGVAIATQRRARFAQGIALAGFEQVRLHQPVEGIHAHQPLAEPADQVEVAQAAGTVLEVGLEVVGGVVVARMAAGARPAGW